MNKEKLIKLRTLLYIILIASSLIMNFSAPAKAYYNPESAFAVEVLLNKPNITYNLSLFESYVEKGTVNIIIVEEENNTFEPGIYYIYRSHYNSNLGVIIREVNDTFTYPTGYQEVEIIKESKLLSFDFELELNESIVDFMSERGYQESDRTVRYYTDNGEEKLVGIGFRKLPEEIEVYVGVPEGVMIPEEQIPANATSLVWVGAPKDNLTLEVDYDVKDMLEFLNIEPNLWDNATHFNYTDYCFLIKEKEKINLEGLSMTLAIPTKYEEIIITLETLTLKLDFEVELNESLISFMENQSYEEAGGGYVNEKLVSLVFKKGEVSVWISSGEGGKTGSGPTTAGETVIWVEGPQIATNTTLDTEVRAMLAYLNIDPGSWDNATNETSTIVDWGLVPAVDLYPEKLDWKTAIETELEWLTTQSIVEGLTENDIQEIKKNAIPGNAGFNGRIIYYNDTWIPYYDSGCPVLTESFGLRLSIEDLPIVTKVYPPQVPPYLYITAFVILLVLGSFSCARLKRNSILNNILRKNIYGCINNKPGIHFRAMLRELNLKQGVLSHHLNILEKEEYIKSRQDGIYRRFYPYEYKGDLKIVLTAIQEKILNVVHTRPGISQSDISKTIGSNRMLVSYHSKILRDAGILAFEKVNRKKLCYTTSLATLYLSNYEKSEI
jgi:DNA-binding MarR family transcriptional regulator